MASASNIFLVQLEVNKLRGQTIFLANFEEFNVTFSFSYLRSKSSHLLKRVSRGLPIFLELHGEYFFLSGTGVLLSGAGSKKR